MLRNFLIAFVGGLRGNHVRVRPTPPHSPFSLRGALPMLSVSAEPLFGIPSASCCFKQACCAIFSSHLLGAFAANMRVSDRILLNPPSRKGVKVWRCLYVLSLYSASPQRAAVSNKHVAQFSHRICWGASRQSCACPTNSPSFPLFPTRRSSDVVCKC